MILRVSVHKWAASCINGHCKCPAEMAPGATGYRVALEKTGGFGFERNMSEYIGE